MRAGAAMMGVALTVPETEARTDPSGPAISISDVPLVYCPNQLLKQTFTRPTPVQVEAIASVPCGNGVITVSSFSVATGRITNRTAAIQDVLGGSTGVLDLGSVDEYSIYFVILDYTGCGPASEDGTPYTTSVTVRETTPNRNAILAP